MGRFRTISVPAELLGDLVDSVNDRLENLRDLVETDALGLTAEDEMRSDIDKLEKLIDILDK